MSSLYNPSPVPSGLRHCWWASDYQYPEPVCQITTLSKEEDQFIRAFEDAILQERIDAVMEEIKNGTYVQVKK